MFDTVPAAAWTVIGVLLVLVNVLGFALMGIDKYKAKRNAWRIKEITLFLPALLGGAVGAFLGMKVFHHKTQHWYFRYGFSLLALLQFGALVWAAAKLT